MKFEPMAHQITARTFAIENPYSILALEMGLGKSFVGLMAFSQVRQGKLIIVCPAYLALNWEREIEKFYPGRWNVVRVRKGSDIPSDFLADIIIMSYGIFPKADHLFEQASMVIADEAHCLKSVKAKRTEAFHKLIFENNVPRLLLLSGTPIKNRVEEFYSLISLCNYNPNVVESKFLKRFPTHSDFADYFSHRREFQMDVGRRRIKIVKWEGMQRVEELKTWLKNIYIRIKSEDVLDLPPVQFKNILVSESTDSMLESAFQDFERGGSEIHPTVKAQTALIKAPDTIKYVKELLNETDSVVVYTDHVDSAHALALGLGVEAITGQMPMNRRMEIAEAFQRGEIPTLVATIGSFSTGVNLTRAHHMILNDFPWVPGDLDQAYFRIIRIGQTKSCIIHHILGSPQDEMILEKIQEKRKILGAVT